MINRETAIVSSLIYKELNKHSKKGDDSCVIDEVIVEDYGNHIQVTIADDEYLETSYLSTSTIQAIGKIFGDDDPTVATNNGLIQLGIINKRIKELIRE